ncbi:MAG: hypothetical protein CME62_08205 [Halobacteriovoraceae bacterium]|nr:hypothetical protein [Halobacteriovoraceae bacterium]|tara:strand:+ start:9938 stop:11038 length:1101 start_codon:yes stop_codon:yes gene_type:complete
MFKNIILLLFVIYSTHSQALLEFEDAVNPELVTSARALAMGNAYMSKVDDGWSAFYNPAGLGTVRGLQFHLTNIHLETNSGFLDITSDGAFTDSLSKYQDAYVPGELRNLHADNPGHTSHSRFQLFPNMTYRGITLGYMYTKQNRARLKTIDDDFEISERVDHGPVMSLSASLFGGIVKFGATAILLNRIQLQKDFAPSETTDIDKELDYTKGTMTHLTAGTRITLPYFMLPTFSMVVRNSSNSGWYDEERSGPPPKIPQTVDYSFSLTPALGRTFRMHLEIGRKDAGDRYDTVPTSRKTVGGIEFDYMRKMFVRFGFGDGWGSGGVGVRNKSFAFDLTTYAIEGSEDGYREDEDRRYVMSISSGF